MDDPPGSKDLDEGVNMSEVESDIDLELEDGDVDGMIQAQVDKRQEQLNMITNNIQDIRMTVTQSMKDLAESEHLVDEVMNMMKPKNSSEPENKSKTLVKEDISSSSSSTTRAIESPLVQGPSPKQIKLQKKEEDEGTVMDAEDRTEDKENSQRSVNLHQQQQPLKVIYQPRKPPKLVKEVKMPRSFSPPPIRRDPALLALPPVDSLTRSQLVEGSKVWAMKETSLMEAWEEATIVQICDREVKVGKTKERQRQYKVCFEEDKTSKFVSGKQLAYSSELSVRVPIGSRVIAVYKDEDEETGDFFPAVIAECPTEANKNRYLVFFDDGFALYLDHKDIRLVYSADQDVWKDVAVNKGHRDFLKDYIQLLPNKPMLTLNEGDKIRTMLNERFYEAEVNDIDASLAQVVFPDETCHWIYRGSLRFEPMFKLKEQIIAKKRKGVIKPVTVPLMEPQQFSEHICDPDCVAQYPYHPEMHRRSNPLRIPLHLGWRRESVAGDFDDSNWAVLYTTPCGRRLRNLEEVHHYLIVTESSLEIDFFAFDTWLTVMREFVPSSDFIQFQDISHGKEVMPLSAVNSYDSSYPPNIEYSTVPVPQRDVHIDPDPGFLIGCECSDGCDNKRSCQCRQLTIKSTIGDAGARENTDAGYVHR